MLRPLAVLFLLAFAAGPAAQEIDFDVRALPAQSYRLDPSHAALIFEVDHLGMSSFMAGFDDIDATLTLDPRAPEAATLTARIRTSSLDLPKPPDGFLQYLLGPDWFAAVAAPEIVFASTSVTPTGPDTARVEGILSLRGAKAPAGFDVTFNGGWAKVPFEPASRLGFSASGTLDRADWGMVAGLPPEGSDFCVAGRVSFRVEAEFIGPPLP